MKTYSKIAKATGVAAIALALVAGGAHPHTANAGATKTVAATTAVVPVTTNVTVATYNVCAEHCPGVRSFSYRAPHIARQISAAGSVIVGVNEAGPSASTKATFTSAMSRYGYKLASGKGGRYLYYKASAASTTSVSGARLRGAGFTVRAGCNTRGGAHQVFRLPDNTLVYVMNAHLTALNPQSKDVCRVNEMKKIMSGIVSPAQRAYPTATTILMGDFNSLNHGNTQASSDGNRHRVHTYLATKGFGDSVKRAQSTSNSTRASVNQMPTDTRRFPKGFALDHFYVESNTAVSKWALVNRAVSYRYQWSDHDMIYARLVIKN